MIPRLHQGHTRSDRDHFAGPLVTYDAPWFIDEPMAGVTGRPMDIGSTDSASGYLNDDLALARRRIRQFFDPERLSWWGNNSCAH
jgi:hypothetical protein